MLEDLFEDKKDKKNFIDATLSEIAAGTAESANQQQKILELEVKVKNYQKENKELYNKIREDNEEYLNVNRKTKFEV